MIFDRHNSILYLNGCKESTVMMLLYYHEMDD